MNRVLLIGLLLIVQTNFAQQKMGLRNEVTGAPVVAAKLAFFEQGEVKAISFADNNGELKIIEAHDSIRITAVGFDTLIAISTHSENKESTLVLLMSPSTLFDEVVVTAQYKPILANNAIQKIRVIPLEQIEQSGANNLADILNYQAGIRISQDNILGSSMSLGGLSGQNVKILIDGVPVIGRSGGNIDLGQINLNNIERIEIVEGPLSVNYGTNALAGTINLISKKQANKSVNFSIKPYYESIGNYNITGSLGFRAKKSQFLISGGRNYFDGWSVQDAFFQFPKSRLADTNRFKTWKPKEQYFGEFRFSTSLKDWQISPYFRYFDELIINRGLPAQPYYEVGIDDYYKTQRGDAGLIIQKKWKKSNFNSIIAYNHFVRKKNTYIKDLTTLQNILSASQGAQDTAIFTLFNWRMSYNHQLNKKLIIEGGLDLNYETAYGRRIEGFLKDQGVYALYSTVEWDVSKKFKIKPGLRYGYNTTYAAPLTPSLNLMYKVKDFNIRMSAARGFRAPTLKELYFDFVDINHNIKGNEELSPEYSMNYSAGVSWLKQIMKKHLLKIDYSFFYNDIDNLITLGVLPSGSFTYLNVGVFKSIGNQLKFDFKSKRFNTGLNISYIGRYNRISSEIASVQPFSFSPELAFNGSYELIKDKLKVNLFYKYNGVLQSFGVNQSGDIIQNKQIDYSILDASFSAIFLKKTLNVILGAKNILNVKDVAVVGSSGGVHAAGGNLNAARGTSLFVSLKYNFTHDIKKKK